MSSRGALIVGLAVTAVLAGCTLVASPWTSRDAAATVPTPDMSDVAYASASPAQVLDVWLPPGGRRPYPLVIFVHGGGFSGGDKRDAAPKVAALLQRGFAVASVDYRLSGEAHFPDPVRDVAAAVRFLRAHAAASGIDSRRFALWGESAGANLATMVGVTADLPTTFDVAGPGADTTSSSVQAVVEWYGPMDFRHRESQFRADAADCRSPQLSEADGYTSGYLGANVDEVPLVAAAADPVTYLRRAAALPRFSIAHGSADCLVPVMQARQLDDALRAVGGQVDLHLLAGAVHADPRFDRELLVPTIEWLSRTLAPEK